MSLFTGHVTTQLLIVLYTTGSVTDTLRIISQTHIHVYIHVHNDSTVCCPCLQQVVVTPLMSIELMWKEYSSFEQVHYYRSDGLQAKQY